MCEIYPHIMEGRASSDTGMGDFEIYLKWSFNEKEAFITENQVYPLKVHDISDLPVLGPNCTYIFYPMMLSKNQLGTISLCIYHL